MSFRRPDFLPHTAIRAFLVVALISSCTEPQPTPDNDASDQNSIDTQNLFWESVAALCGSSFEGRVVDNEPPDPSLDDERLVMHVRECGDDIIRIPFHVGSNRSRTWVVTRTPRGLMLKHDHRHEDGSEDEITQYGGDTRDAGTARAQHFYADSLTAQLVPAARTNIWSIEIEPGLRFTYALRRTDSERRFRAEFDLQRTIETPPPPWGG